MKKLIPLTMAACLSFAMAGAYADDMKKDGMMKQDGAMMKDDMGKDGMKKPHKKATMKKEDKSMGQMGMGEMKKDDDKMGKGEMKK